MDESHTIPVKFKRKLCYNHAVLSDNVRPNKVLDAANWLINNSQLYKEEGVTVLHSWPEALNNIKEDWKEFLPSSIDPAMVTSEQQKGVSPEADTEMQPDSDDEWTEVTKEGNHPLGLYQDKYSEKLAFPTLFCGQPRSKNNVKVHYSEICKWELRHKDRRFAKCVPNIFYKTKKLQINQIQQKVTLSLRKKKLEGKKLTAKDSKTCNVYKGFRVFRTLRGSPPYWENSKKERFAMIRQLGIPTWFISFSAAETRWLHLLRTLGRTLHNKEFTDSQILNMTWQEKSDLIQSDPVTCSRHFDYSVHRLISDVMHSSYHPVGNIIDYFYRAEFQQRGSPHIHMLAWVKNAPQCGSATNEQVVSFVDRYVACKKPPTLNHSVTLQTHSHAKTCRKKRQGICRFGFPLPPMPKTVILTPAYNSDQEHGKESLSVLYKRIKGYLDGLKLADDVTVTFAEMLQILDMTEDQYMRAIRWSLTSDKLFLKRSPSEIRVNAYNKSLLETWKANMDIQYVLDPYACAMYIVSYISRGQRGMSNLMQRATKEARDDNHDIKQRVRHIGNKFVNHVELSAQEAVYLVLQMSLRKATRQFDFINTSPSEERIVLLNPLSVIQELPDDSTDVECMGLVKKYTARPKVLENYCLADFAACFDVSTSKSKDAETEDVYEVENEDDPIEQSPDEKGNELCEDSKGEQTRSITVGALTFRKRNKAKIIRYVRFNKENDPEKYYREQLMLFVPWKCESDILGSFKSYQDRYATLEIITKEKEAEYNHNSEALDNAIECLDNADVELPGDIAPNSEHANEQDRLEKQKRASKDGPKEMYDIGQDIGIAVNNVSTEELVKPRMPEDDYHSLVNSLNTKQKQFFYHLLHWCKTKCEPLYVFLTGGAGVGKSQVLKGLYNALLRYYSAVPGNDPDDTHILLMAPTGKAAYGIKGNTIHCALQIPANQGLSSYKALTADKLNSLQFKYHSLKVIFIDEISVVGHRMFRYIDQRLQQIMGSKKVFGGISIIAVDDLFQLKPVRDGWIFNDLTDNYGPLATNLWKSNFTAYELTEIMRQKDEQLFAQLLNRLREGNQTYDDLATLKSRQFSSVKVPKEATHLFQTNDQVNAHNNKMFDLLSTTKVQIPAIDVVTGDVSNPIKQTILDHIPDNPNNTMGLASNLYIGVGQRVDLCINVAVDDGLINGASGVVKCIQNSQANQIHTVWIHFDDSSLGKALRQSANHHVDSDLSSLWTPITRIARQFRTGRSKNAEILRKQFPLRPASAKTVHRCQGDTLSEVVVDMSGRRSQSHIHYVALSRVTSLNGLHLLNLNEEKINVDRNVLEEMQLLRRERIMKTSMPTIPTTENTTTVLHQNVRSLKKHLVDIKSDSTVLSADILIFTECHLSTAVSAKSLQIHGYNLFLNMSAYTSACGTALYMKNTITTKQRSLNSNNVEITAATANTTSGILQIIVIYRPPTTCMEIFLKVLTQLFTALTYNTTTIIMGDFNVNLLQDSSDNDSLLFLMKSNNFKQIIHGITTDYNSCLDHVYGNFSHTNIEASGIQESFFSDHKMVWITLKQLAPKPKNAL
ncbi:ATP-dependent DNA helicase PIF1 [Holothuria leucospilota]|uniref:ATP-dependent DNA helicase n=1 Tax=Holothuria leucospilota TaxID=206669 RepID=A0A9Q1H9Q5_HOLLE|nr:ATP-dependent DNA helicase PIF1 [Holothuria leucospilota]